MLFFQLQIKKETKLRNLRTYSDVVPTNTVLDIVSIYLKTV